MSLKSLARKQARALDRLAIVLSDKVGDAIAELIYGRTRKKHEDRRVRRYDELGVPAYEMIPRGDERRRPRG